MGSEIVQCVPNFSEGRDAQKIAQIVDAVHQCPGVRLVDWSADPDHNRMVVTFVGGLDAVTVAARAAAAKAIEIIDLRHHEGVHPRLGAIDVLPFVPVKNVSMDACAEAARAVARQLGADYDLPAFLYEYASPVNRSLPEIRKTAFDGLRPDYGPNAPHPTAGAVVIGARQPLIAFNVNLTDNTPAIARRIARELREGGVAGFTGVRSLGLALPSRAMSQVSMNIVRTESVRLHALYDYIAKRAEELGTQAVESELIGAMPGYSAFALLQDSIALTGLKPGQVLWENWPEQD